MDPRAPEDSLRHPLQRHHRRHQASLRLRHTLWAASWGTLAVTGMVLAGVPLAMGESLAWARLGLLVFAILGLAWWAARRLAGESERFAGWLERAERRFPELRSWVRNAVDFEREAAPHTSAALSDAVRVEARRRIAATPLASLTPPVRPRGAAARAGVAALAVLTAAVLWPASTARSWKTLWNPAVAAPPVELSVEPGSVTVTPGATLAVRARVRGTGRAPRLDRSRDGAVAPVAEGQDERGSRVWRFDLAQLTRAQEYWVQVGGSRSPRYRIALSGATTPVGFDVEYHAPAYARLPVQRGATARGDLSALRGTRAHVVVTFDRDLEQLSARLPEGRTVRWSPVTPRRWRGELTMTRDGDYELIAEARRGADESGRNPESRFRYQVTALPDAPPVLSVQVPEQDVDLPEGQRIPLDVIAQDDLGLTELMLQFRKGPEGAWTDLPLVRFTASPREARVRSSWDASPLALLPGEQASFRFVLYDDNAVGGRGRAVSPTFEVRFPSLAELYERVDDRQAGAQKNLERVAETARELQQSLDKLVRQQPRPEPAPSSSFERSEELRKAMDRQQEMSRQIQEAADQLRQSLDDAAERRAFDDELMRKLREVSELMEQIESEEFKESLRRMQEAMKNMDRQALERKLPEWQAENKDLLRNLERTIDLLKKLRDEERLQALGKRAQDLKQQQDELNREYQDKATSDPKQADQLAERQEQAAEESEKLGEDVAQEAEASEDPQQKQDLQKTSESLKKEASDSQREAAQAAESQAGEQAMKAGQKASSALESAADQLSEMASAMEMEQESLDVAAVRRAAQDLVSLQRAGDRQLRSETDGAEGSNRLTDLAEGTSRVADSLFQLSRETPFISQGLSEALGRAITGLQQSGKDMSGGQFHRGQESGRTALQSLNEAVLELRQAEESMCNKGGGRPGGKLNPQRLGEISDQQSQLNRETRSVAQKLSEQMRLSAGDREQMRRLAEEQARIREQIEEIGADDAKQRELLGRLDQAGREMEDVEEVLREGALTGDLEERQQRILSRLLDASRSVNRRDFDPQRESQAGTDAIQTSPAPLSTDLLRQSDRFRQDLLRSELDRYPAQYRAFVETYLRSLNGSPR